MTHASCNAFPRLAVLPLLLLSYGTCLTESLLHSFSVVWDGEKESSNGPCGFSCDKLGVSLVLSAGFVF